MDVFEQRLSCLRLDLLIQLVTDAAYLPDRRLRMLWRFTHRRSPAGGSGFQGLDTRLKELA